MLHAKDEHGNIKIRPKPRTGQPQRSDREQWIWERKNLLGWPDWYIRQELKEWDRIHAEQEARRKAEWKEKLKRVEEKKRAKRGGGGGNRKKSNRRGRA